MKTARDYETFVVDVLKPQLASFVKNCEEVSEEYNGYNEIKNIVLKQQKQLDNDDVDDDDDGGDNSNSSGNNSNIDTTTLTQGPHVDVGEDCLVQTEIYNKEEIYIHIGMGFHISLPPSEALSVIETRQQILTDKLSHLQERCEEIAAYINEILPIISELKHIEGVEKNTEG